MSLQPTQPNQNVPEELLPLFNEDAQSLTVITDETAKGQYLNHVIKPFVSKAIEKSKKRLAIAFQEDAIVALGSPDQMEDAITTIQSSADLIKPSRQVITYGTKVNVDPNGELDDLESGSLLIVNTDGTTFYIEKQKVEPDPINTESDNDIWSLEYIDTEGKVTQLID